MKNCNKINELQNFKARIRKNCNKMDELQNFNDEQR